MKILFLGKSLDEHSGWGRYAWEIISRVRKRHEVKVFVEEGSGKDCEEAVLIYPQYPWEILTNKKIVKQAAKFFDVIHCLDGYPYALYAAGSARPFFVNGIGTYSVAPLENVWKGIFLKRAYAKARQIFCISRFTQAEIEKRTGLLNLSVVHLAVDLEKFKSLDQERNRMMVVGVGALKRRKGYHVAIAAIDTVRRELPAVKYIIVGRREQTGYGRELEGEIARRGLENNIEFAGDISDKQLVELYNQSRVFLLLPVNSENHFEGFGLVFLEAAACGLPVIGTMNNGDEDAINNGANGFLVPQNDPEAAAEALTKLLKDHRLWQNFSHAGAGFAKTFSWEKTVDHYLQAYHVLV